MPLVEPLFTRLTYHGYGAGLRRKLSSRLYSSRIFMLSGVALGNTELAELRFFRLSAGDLPPAGCITCSK